MRELISLTDKVARVESVKICTDGVNSWEVDGIIHNVEQSICGRLVVVTTFTNDVARKRKVTTYTNVKKIQITGA